MRSIPVVVSLALSYCTVVTSVSAETWNQFRGSTGGQVTDVAHPLEWSAEKNIAWAVPMKGSGWSSPIVVGDRVFFTAAESEDGSRPKGMMAGVASMRSFKDQKPVNHKFVVNCIRLDDGTPLWSKTVGEMVPPVVHPSNTYATESPTSDGKHVYTFFATTGTLTAWDLDGEEIWKKELGTYKSGNGFGSGSSLAISDGKVFVQFDNDENSFVAAFDTQTGEQVWRDDRPTKTSWSTPIVWDNSKQKELVACGSAVVTSYDPNDGSVNWKLSGMESGFSGSPAIGGDRIFFGNSGPRSAGPLVAVSAGIDGDVTLDNDFKSEDVSWSRTKSGPGMASPVVAKGCLYITSSGSILNCYDAETGERVYRTRVPDMSTVAASLWADDEHVFILDENGITHVIQAGPEFKVLHANKLEDLFWSTPTIAGDALLLRGVEKLYCVR